MGLFDALLKKGHKHDEENVRVVALEMSTRPSPDQLGDCGMGEMLQGCRVYLFKRGYSQGTKDMKQLLGE